MKKANCVILIGFILFLNLLSLNSSSSFQSTNSLESVSDSVEDPLIVGTTSLGYDLDPQFSMDKASSDINNQIWEGLYAHNLGDPSLRIIPRLAADCGVWREDGFMYDVKLRQNVSYHNGDPFNASCVVDSFNRLYNLCVFEHDQVRELYFPYGFNGTEEGYNDEDSNYGYIIKSTKALDNYKVRFTLNYPYMPFQALLCYSASYIMHPNTPKDSYLQFCNITTGDAIGTGPYIITEHTTDNCSFEYFQDYYRGTPAIKKIVYKKFSNSIAISQALLEGDIDLPFGYDPDFMEDFEASEHIYVSSYREFSIISYLVMKNENIDRKYRQAINHAIDYDKIIDEMYGNYPYYGYARRMKSIVPPGHTYHKECDVPILNITKARQILIEAGHTQGYGLDENSTDDDWKNVAESDNPLFTIEYAYFLGNIFKEDLGLLIIDNLKEIGIRVYLKGLYMHYGVDIRKYDMYMVSWIPDYNYPSQVLNELMSNTSSGYYGQVNDQWLQLAMEEALTTINEDDRKALYYDIQDYIATDLMPVVFIATPLYRFVRTNYVLTQPNPMGKFYVFPFSWHGENTTFNDPYLELWCNTRTQTVLEFWFEPKKIILGYSLILVSLLFLVVISLGIKNYKKKLNK